MHVSKIAARAGAPIVAKKLGLPYDERSGKEGSPVSRMGARAERKMKRQMIAFLLSAALLLPAAALAETMYVTMPNDGSANLRISPSTEADICGELPDGTAVEVLEASGIWSRIGTDAESAWIMTRYLSADPEAKAEGAAQEADSIEDLDFSSFRVTDPYYAYVQASVPGGFVNLRWAPSRSAAVARRISDGGEVIVYAEGSGWMQAMDAESGYIGFIRSESLIVPAGSGAGSAD